MISTSGSLDEHPRQGEHLLLAARQAVRGLLATSRRARGRARGPRRCARRPRRRRACPSHALTERFWSTVRLGKTPLPPGSETIPSCTRCSGRHVGDRCARGAARPRGAAPRGRSRPAGSSTSRRRSCRAARRTPPARPRSSRRTAPAPTRTRSRRSRPAARASPRPSSARLRCSSCSSSSSSTTSDRSLRMKRAPFISSRPPMMLVGTPSAMTVPRIPIALVKKPESTPPRKPPMKKMYIVAIAVPMPRSRYGHDGLEDRPRHRERGGREHRLRDAEDPERRRAVHRVLQRREERRREDQRARPSRAPSRGSCGRSGRSTARRTAGTAARRSPRGSG